MLDTVSANKIVVASRGCIFGCRLFRGGICGRWFDRPGNGFAFGRLVKQAGFWFCAAG